MNEPFSTLRNRGFFPARSRLISFATRVTSFQYVLLLDGDCEHLVFYLYGIHRWDVFRKLGQKYDICLKVKSFVLVYSQRAMN